MSFNFIHVTLLISTLCLAGSTFFYRNKSKNSLTGEEKRKIREFDSVNIDLEKAKATITSITGQLSEKQAAIDKLDQKNQNLKEEVHSANILKAQIAEQKKALGEKVIEQQAFITEAQKNLKEQFENIANKQLQENAEKFSKDSSKNLDLILKPLSENIENFKKEFSETYNREARERFSLEKVIKQIAGTNENLTKALKGDKKLQGNWGEVILERFLEDAGLEKDTHYKTQGSITNEEGKRQLPDVLILLPEEKHIVVDSKVSLVAYERYFSEESEPLKAIHAKDFVDSIKRHIKDLGTKNYQNNPNIKSLDFVIMFMPIEGTFQLASQYFPNIFSYGWDSRVVITSPSTLFPILKTISSIWKVDAQNKNTQEIIKTATLLYDKFTGFVSTMEEVGKHIDRTGRAYKEAISQLKDGNGNAISITNRLKNFGIDRKRIKKISDLMRDDPSEDEEAEAPVKEAAALS